MWWTFPQIFIWSSTTTTYWSHEYTYRDPSWVLKSTFSFMRKHSRDYWFFSWLFLVITVAPTFDTLWEHTLKYIHNHVDDIPNLNKIKLMILQTVLLISKIISPTKSSAAHKVFMIHSLLLIRVYMLIFVFWVNFLRIKMVMLSNRAMGMLNDLMVNKLKFWLVMVKLECCMMIHVWVKSSHLNYLESFLNEYAPECKNKWVVLDQSELYNNPTVSKNFSKILPWYSTY